MFSTPEFWVAVAFVIFMAIVWKAGGFRAIASGLDARGARIRAELDEAGRLRAEAAQVLADYKRRREEAEKEADAIVAQAREEAERVAQEAHAKMADFVARRTAAAESKIAQAEALATAQVRTAAADAAIRASETVLRASVTGKTARDILVRSLADVKTRLN